MSAIDKPSSILTYMQDSPTTEDSPRLTKIKPWVVATDGSADHIAGLAAHAWWAKDGSHYSNCVTGDTSVMAEWAAIEAALGAAPLGRPVKIYSDYRYAVKLISKALASNAKSSTTILNGNLPAFIKDSISRIEKLADGRDVTISWVRAHTGDRGSLPHLNKMADHLARRTLRKRRYFESDHYVI